MLTAPFIDKDRAVHPLKPVSEKPEPPLGAIAGICDLVIAETVARRRCRLSDPSHTYSSTNVAVAGRTTFELLRFVLEFRRLHAIEAAALIKAAQQLSNSASGLPHQVQTDSNSPSMPFSASSKSRNHS